MTRRRLYLSVVLAVLAIALATAGSAAACCAGPYTPPGGTHKIEVPSEGGGQTGNPLGGLGGESKSHPFPLNNYGLDEHVQFGVTHLGNTFNAVTEWVIQMIWFGLIYLFNGIMMMLQWAFSVDLLQKSMSKLTEYLGVMREHIDTPWGLAAVAVMALWGIWNGLVRRKSIDTLRGLLISVLCMVALLVVIGNPVGTLGQFTSIANGASTEMLDSITSGSVKEPQHAVGSTEKSLFSTVIESPWCALQFGDVEYCLSEPKGVNQSVADTWLQAPPGSSWRTSLWKITKSDSADRARGAGYGKNPPGSDRDLGDMYNLAGQPQRMELISGGGSSGIARLGLLVLIVIGLAGAICLFGYLSARLLEAALFLLVLALIAPLMFLLAAFGQVGRESVAAWFKRIISAAATKVGFAFFLAVIVAASNLVTEMKLGFYATWIVFIAFWWGLLLKRKDLLALVFLDPKTASPSGIDFNGAAGGRTLSELFYARQLVGDVRRGARRVGRGATVAPRAVGRRGKDVAKRALEAGRLGQTDAAREFAREKLEGLGRSFLEGRNAEEHRSELAKARNVFDQEARLEAKISGLGLPLKNGRGGKPRSRNKKAADPASPISNRLPKERDEAKRELSDLRASSGYAWARSTVGSKPREVTDREVQGWMKDRRAELDLQPEAPENLRAAGIDRKAFYGANALGKDAYREEAYQVMQRHKELFDLAGIGKVVDKREPLGFRERRQVRDEMNGSGRQLRYRNLTKERARERRQELRSERRNERRRRRNVR